ncbi:MAG TPA: hypothetical protein VHH73_07085 [Verrucomicrobiae bacterium]|nr:hypothetical protein [Verrucomicrobiae bacterium]
MANHHLDLNKPLREVDGSEAGADPLSKWLATMLKSSRSGDAVKYLDWAIELTKSGKLELDTADFDHLRDFVKNDSTIVALVKGQLLKEFIAAKG